MFIYSGKRIAGKFAFGIESVLPTPTSHPVPTTRPVNVPTYLAEDSDGDWQGTIFLSGLDAVAQAIKTRLLLWQGEWFNDTNDGTPYMQSIVGYNQQPDVWIKNRIATTTLNGKPVILGITNYSASIINRQLTVNADVDTVYGKLALGL